MEQQRKKIKTPSEAKYDARLLSWGVFEGLSGFMDQRQWEQACLDGAVDGRVVGLPMTLPLSTADAADCSAGSMVELVDAAGFPYATMRVDGVFKVDAAAEALSCLGTVDPAHPWVAKLASWGDWRAHGPILAFGGDLGADPFSRWLSPQQISAAARARGWTKMAAMQTRNPLHGAHLDLARRALSRADVDGLLLHPAMGITKEGDLPPEARVRCYEAAMGELPAGKALLAYAPLAMRMAGPREALWHAMVRKGFGAAALIVGRDHAGPGRDSKGEPFYDPQAAMRLAVEMAPRMGIDVIPFEESVYSPKRRRFVQPFELEWGEEPLALSGTAMRGMIARGERLPAWFTPPSIAAELAPAATGGVGIFLTGLSGAGKSTLAERLAQRWRMRSGRPLATLDGDEVRKLLSSELGFSRAHRDLNVSRLGFVAAEIMRQGGACVIAAIAPYEGARQEAMGRMSQAGVACQVHVCTSLQECERRDPKGLYAKARSGELRGFTGIDDPYEEPQRPDLKLDLEALGLERACELVEEWLAAKASAVPG